MLPHHSVEVRPCEEFSSKRRDVVGLLFHVNVLYCAPHCIQSIAKGYPGMNLLELVEPAVALARSAGDAILEVYATDFDVQAKDDDSPLTQADMASHRVIEAFQHRGIDRIVLPFTIFMGYVFVRDRLFCLNRSMYCIVRQIE